MPCNARRPAMHAGMRLRRKQIRLRISHAPDDRAHKCRKHDGFGTVRAVASDDAALLFSPEARFLLRHAFAHPTQTERMRAYVSYMNELQQPIQGS